MAALALALLSLKCLVVLSNSDPDVQLDLGRIRGVKEMSTEGKEFYSFMGVPYAKPPLGHLRLKDPEMVDSWTGVLDATEMPPYCPQFFMVHEKDKPRTFAGKEDCLFLNVFTPKPNELSANLPVMVYFHGGAFYAGGANKYRPYQFLNEPIVLVVPNYRLGTLGFMTTEDDVIPGNFGLKDQTLALEWVHNNIIHFGGDPDRVTIFGESAGGASVHYHLLSPASNGLFLRAILQSGTAFCPWAWSGAFPQKDATYKVARLLGCPAKEGPEVLLRCLQEVPFRRIASAYELFIKFAFTPVMFGPWGDGVYLRASPEELMKKGQHSKVEVMSGVTRDDGAFVTLLLFNNQTLMKELEENFEEVGPVSLEFYDGSEVALHQSKIIYEKYLGKIKINEATSDDLTKLYGDRYFNFGHDVFCQYYLENTKNNVYMYEFNYRGQHSYCDNLNLTIGNNWVSHMDDVHYLFSPGSFFPKLERESDQKVAKMMIKLWTNFARNGNPTPDDTLGFRWDPATSKSISHLSITEDPQMEGDHRAEMRTFWASLPLQDNLALYPEWNDDAIKKEEL